MRGRDDEKLKKKFGLRIGSACCSKLEQKDKQQRQRLCEAFHYAKTVVIRDL